MAANHKQMIERLLEGIDSRNIAVMDELFHEDALMDWPQFGERVRGGENRRNVYQRIPTLPKVAPRRIFGSGELWVAEALLDYDGSKYNAIFVFEFRDGKIARETGYWATPSEPAAWRAQWVERL
ncbi:MAG: nuclear transport factor 2 family protein [Bradyrhizobiaceae bacterium]|nr:nuclear transport factor 2 family protein [Bradyrhizobiaceae bacterium]